MGEMQDLAALLHGIGFERLASAGGIDRDGAEQLLEDADRGQVEAEIGAARQRGDLPQGGRGGRVVAFVKDDRRRAETTELAGEMAQFVRRLLHRVTDKDERTDLVRLALADRMVEDA